MIIFKEGNLLQSQADVLVNTVNTVGVMGKGIALQFKIKFPQNFKVYVQAIEKGHVKVGQVLIVEVNASGPVKYIVNFPTKQHWRSPSQLSWIKSGLDDLKGKLSHLPVKSIALPPLGCGNGGLDWAIVKPLMIDSLKDLDMEVMIYEPSEQIKKILAEENRPSAAKLSPTRAMLLYLLYQYRVLGEDISEFAAEKLCYFLQRFGETQLKFDFEKGHYGPYSGKVRHLLHALNGFYIKGFEQKQAKPFEPLELIMSNQSFLDEYLAQNISVSEKERLRKVAHFIQGFETPYGLELLATVDYPRLEKRLNRSEDVIPALKEWSDRKAKMFDPEHVALAFAHIEQESALI